MRHFLPLLLAVLCAGCASALEKAERAERLADSRTVEAARMRKLDMGEVGSQRGAELAVPSKFKTFDLATATRGSGRTFQTGGARTRDFNYAQKVQPQSYETRGFGGMKMAAAGGKRFATSAGATSGKYEIPNATTSADTKSAPVKDAREAGRSTATRALVDGSRPYLGKESEKVRHAIEPKALANWRNSGISVTGGPDGPIEVFGQMKELSIEDVREILNKNK